MQVSGRCILLSRVFSASISRYYYLFFSFQIYKEIKKTRESMQAPRKPNDSKASGHIDPQKSMQVFLHTLCKTCIVYTKSMQVQPCIVFKKVCRFGGHLPSKSMQVAFLPAHFCLVVMSEIPKDRMPKGSYRPFCMFDNRADEGVGRVNMRPSDLPSCTKQP